MNRTLALAAALALQLVPASAQGETSAPFDMSPERPASAPPVVPVLPAPMPADAVSPAPNTAPPAAGVDTGADDKPGAIDPTVTADAPTPGQPAAAGSRRFLLPDGELTLSGEVSRRGWSTYLTPAQAASPAILRMGYRNAVVVAPEASRLTVRLNGQSVLDEPISSSEGAKTVFANLAAGSLRPGWNDFEVEAAQRHRTDCTIQSTYELWTQVDPASSFLEFAAPGAAALSGLDDLRAVGADAKGRTRFHMVIPAFAQGQAAQPALRMAQVLALSARMPDEAVSIAPVPPSAVPEAAAPGLLNVVMGTPAEIATLVPQLPHGGETGPAIGFAPVPALGGTALVATGPSWAVIGNAVDAMLKPFERSPDTRRTVLSSRAWRNPEAPMLFGSASVRFSDLGVATQEFTGRRFRTEFAVGVPADFYANAYGEARILLDAAYNEAVEPGSHLDVYVNGAIASTLPITSAGGAILRHLPVKVPMRHFRPGANTVAIEAVLLTEADRACAPGATAVSDKRFVLFNTSEWVMPTFARIAQFPNLAALGGTAFPYGQASVPLSVITDRGAAAESLSAAATLLVRMANSAGRPIAVDVDASAASAVDRNALFVGPVGSLSPDILAQAGVAEASRTGWMTGDVGEGADDTAETFAKWRDQLRNSDWRGQVGVFGDWLQRTFNLSLGSLHLRPQEDAPFMPGSDAGLLVAQNASPSGDAVWTVVTAPDAASLSDGVRTLARQEMWSGMAGRVTTLNTATDRLSTVPAGEIRLAGAEPESLGNYRLIAANWLSDNVLVYSLGLAGFAVLLGLVTAGLLRSLGRHR